MPEVEEIKALPEMRSAIPFLEVLIYASYLCTYLVYNICSKV